MLLRFGKRMKLRRLRRELLEWKYLDREMRDEPGETNMRLPNKMLAIGHRISSLTFEIAALEEELKCEK